MNEEMKTKLFEEMLKLEHLSEGKTFDNHDYFEQIEGAWKMLAALGLTREYAKWSVGK